LAVAQSRWVQHELELLGVEVELLVIRTEGDNNLGSLSKIGGQGLFTRQLQTSLRRRQIDLAVHSLKDLPTQNQPDLRIAAIPSRESRADVLVSSSGKCIADLPAQSVIGTGSVRRAALLRRLRPDLEFRDTRGNVDTRLAKLDAGEFDAIVLAAAGLNRLGLQRRITQSFDTGLIFPAIGQGALALEIRDDDTETASALALLNDWPSYVSAMAERAMLRALDAGCLSAVGADCTMHNGKLVLTGIVLSPDGQRWVSATGADEAHAHEALGQAVAQSLLDQGARALLAIQT
jgi:hydroxymethylbilane synthase